MANAKKRRKRLTRNEKKEQLRKDLPEDELSPEETEPDWSGFCNTCGATPIVPVTGMCGPCTFGEAETANGNW